MSSYLAITIELPEALDVLPCFLQLAILLLILLLIISIPIALIVVLTVQLVRLLERWRRRTAPAEPSGRLTSEYHAPARSNEQARESRLSEWCDRLSLLIALGVLIVLSQRIAGWAVGGLIEAGWSNWIVWPLAVLTFIAAFIGIMILSLSVTADGRVLLKEMLGGWRQWPGRLARLPITMGRLLHIHLACEWRRSLQRDLRAIRKATGHQGRVRTDGLLTIWTDMDHSVEDCMRSMFAQSADCFAGLRGQPLKKMPPLRVLCFATTHAMHRYSRPWSRGEILSGYFFRLRACRVVIDGEATGLLPQGLEQTAAHEFAHYWSHETRSHWKPPWLEEGVAVWVATSLVPSCSEPNATYRQFASLRQREQACSPRELLKFGYAQLLDLLACDRDVASAYKAYAVYLQGYILVRWLAEKKTDVLSQLLSQPGKPWRKPVRTFEKIVGMTPEKAWDEAEATLGDSGNDHAGIARAEPRPDVVVCITDRLVPDIRDPEVPEYRRRRAIRTWSRLGYCRGAQTLIDALARETDPTMREELIYALSAVAGRHVGDDPQDWRQWLGPTQHAPATDDRRR